MRQGYILILSIFLAFAFLGIQECYSQNTREEQQEKSLAGLEVKKLPPSYKLYSRVNLSSGYDTNAGLSPVRKSDIFEELLYSLSFSKPLVSDIKFTFNYDMDVLNYDKFTDASNILNHFRLGAQKKFSPFSLGTAYDLAIFYYPNSEESDFLFQRGLFFIRQDVSKNMYHQLNFESGLKDYPNKHALADTISDYQDKKRRDQRLGLEYSLGSSLGRRLLLLFKTKFSINDSNARYLDFYDYKSYQFTPGIDYALSRNLHFIWNFTYLRKRYEHRTVTLKDYKQKDNFYSGTAGLNYKLDKRNAISLSYAYRANCSNEPLEKYSENVITCGWQYNF